jgi:hypothetical protein
MLSPWRDLEHCFRLRWMPSSVRNEKILVDAWTDYLVHSAFEIDSEDFPALLSRRDFKEEELWPSRITRFKEFDNRFGSFGEEGVADIYLWSDPNGSRCRVITNSDRNKVLVTYSAD